MNASTSVSPISFACAYDGLSEKPDHSPCISRPRNRCQPMPLRPTTYGLGSMPRSRSRPASASASRRMLALKPPANPRSLVTISTAALCGFSLATISGCSAVVS